MGVRRMSNEVQVILAAMVARPDFFEHVRLTAQQLQAVRAVRDLGRPTTSSVVARHLHLSVPHASALLKGGHDRGYLARFNAPAVSGGTEWVYSYELPEAYT
jgi:hypothetical protein